MTSVNHDCMRTQADGQPGIFPNSALPKPTEKAASGFCGVQATTLAATSDFAAQHASLLRQEASERVSGDHSDHLANRMPPEAGSRTVSVAAPSTVPTIRG